MITLTVRRFWISCSAATLSVLMLPVPAACASNSLAAATAASTDPVSDSARQRAQEIIDLINKGDVEANEQYVRSSFSPSYIEEYSVKRIVRQLNSAHLSSREVNPREFSSVSRSSSEVLFWNSLTEDLERLVIAVDDDGKITRFEIEEYSDASQRSSGKNASESDALNAIGAFAARLAAADAWSGVIMIARPDRVLLSKAYGPAERRFGAPNRIDTKFNLGSINKMFTSLAISRLVEDGRLSYEDSISKFLPDFPDPESAKLIKIKHLLSHTAGLGSFFNEKFKLTPPGKFRTQDDYLDIAGQDGLLFAPGSDWSYSNTGMLLLGEAIESVTGRSYYDYMRETFFAELGMVNTDSYALDAVVPNMAYPYESMLTQEGIIMKDAIHDLPVRGSSAGGGFSTAPDLLRFSKALLSGQIVSPSTLALMTSPKPELNSTVYGYGFFLGRFSPPGVREFGHGGDAPGTCAHFGVLPDAPTRYTVIVLSNSSVGSCHPIVRKAYQLLPN